MTAFKYLEQVLKAGDDDWLAVVGNHSKARKSWGAVVANIYPGGGGSEGVGAFFLSGVADHVAVRGGEVGAYP